MIIGADERGLVIQAIATLAYRKADMVNFVLKPAGVPGEIYGTLPNQRDDITGQKMSKRDMAPGFLETLGKRPDYTDIVWNIVKIAASWDKFELSHDEFGARAVKAKAQELLRERQLLERDEATRKETELQEQAREALSRKSRN